MQASIRNHRGTPALKTITAIIAIHRPHHHHFCRRHFQDHNHVRRRNQHHRHEQDHHQPQNQIFIGYIFVNGTAGLQTSISLHPRWW